MSLLSKNAYKRNKPPELILRAGVPENRHAVIMTKDPLSGKGGVTHHDEIV
jgi:hypothetical protein